jgi:hypothetical protein
MVFGLAAARSARTTKINLMVSSAVPDCALLEVWIYAEFDKAVADALAVGADNRRPRFELAWTGADDGVLSSI